MIVLLAAHVTHILYRDDLLIVTKRFWTSIIITIIKYSFIVAQNKDCMCRIIRKKRVQRSGL